MLVVLVELVALVDLVVPVALVVLVLLVVLVVLVVVIVVVVVVVVVVVGRVLLGLSPSALISGLAACGAATRPMTRSRKRNLCRTGLVPDRGGSTGPLPVLRPPSEARRRPSGMLSVFHAGGAELLLNGEPFTCSAAERSLSGELGVAPASGA